LSSLRVFIERRASASSLIDFFSGRAFHRSTVPAEKIIAKKKSFPILLCSNRWHLSCARFIVI